MPPQQVNRDLDSQSHPLPWPWDTHTSITQSRAVRPDSSSAWMHLSRLPPWERDPTFHGQCPRPTLTCPVPNSPFTVSGFREAECETPILGYGPPRQGCVNSCCARCTERGGGRRPHDGAALAGVWHGLTETSARHNQDT